MPFPYRIVLLSGALTVVPVAAQADDLDPPTLIAGDTAEGGAALTPMDQGTSPQDVRVTQSLRQALTKSDQLSLSGRNVKIITRDGVVTLRGPVKDAREKAAIAATAKATAGVKRVDDQLEIQ
jgi:osmotically-inducible protein OsmY